jgi:hypothetical protein
MLYSLGMGNPAAAAAAAVKMTRISAGNYHTEHAGHAYDVQRVTSDYGDAQWTIDRDGRLWTQADSLGQARQWIGNDR